MIRIALILTALCSGFALAKDCKDITGNLVSPGTYGCMDAGPSNGSMWYYKAVCGHNGQWVDPVYTNTNQGCAVHASFRIKGPRPKRR